MADASPSRVDAVVFHEYSKLLYAWPIILLGFVFWFLAPPREVPDPTAPMAVRATEGAASEQPAAEGEAGEGAKIEAVPATVRVAGEHEVLGWVYLVVMFLVLLTLCVDVERNLAAFWGVVAVALWLAFWLLSEKDIPVFSHVYRYFADLDVSYDRAYGLALSIFLAPPFVGMLIWARLNHRWRITHNEFEHLSWGRADDSLARGAKRVRSTYPDLLEFILGFGAGTLIVYSASGRGELRRIPNVPMLFRVRNRVDRLLESTQVTMAAGATPEAIADDMSAEEGEGGGGEVGGEKL